MRAFFRTAKPSRERNGQSRRRALTVALTLGSAGLGVGLWTAHAQRENGGGRRGAIDASPSDFGGDTTSAPDASNGVTADTGAEKKAAAKKEALQGLDAPRAARPPHTALPFDAPSLDAYRNDVRAFPHGTPPTLLAFAARLESRFTEALQAQSPEPRAALADDLARCTTDTARTLPFAVRSYCLLRFEDFVAKAPEHADSYQAALASTPDRFALRTPHRGLK